jgi:hypothetical protein
LALWKKKIIGTTQIIAKEKKEIKARGRGRRRTLLSIQRWKY